MITDELDQILYNAVCDRIDKKYPDADNMETRFTRNIMYAAARSAIMVIQEYEKLTDHNDQEAIH